MKLYKLILPLSILLVPFVSQAALGDILYGSSNPSINYRLTIGASSTCITSNGSIPSWGSCGAGGGGSPASPSYSIQYNNSGSFGGSSNATIDSYGNASFNGQVGIGGYSGLLGAASLGVLGDNVDPALEVLNGAGTAGVGIGETLGNDNIMLNSNGSASFSGNVGISQTTPATALDVNGYITSESLAGSPSFVAVDNTGQFIATTTPSGGSGTVNSGTAGQAAFYNTTGTAVSGTSTLFFSNGNVGIGTTTPATALDVHGYITTESVKSAACLATDSTGKIVSTTCGTGSGGAISTSTVPTIGQVPYWTSTSALGSVATGTITCAGTASCGAGSYVIGNNLTITGSGSASGLGTSSPWTVGNLAYVVSNGAVSSVGTSTLSASSPLTGSFTQVGSGGALGIQVANTSQGGYLSNTDWNTFNGKQAAGSYLTSVTADSPLGGSGTSGSHLTCATCNTTNATVSSVAMTTPTGLSVSGSPITTSGTLGLTLTAGYNIPLTASTTSWNNSLASTTALNGVSPITYNGSTGAIGCSTCNTTASNVINVTNSDGTLTISPTTGNVVGSIALGHANTWTGGQTFTSASTTNFAITGLSNTVLAVNANGSVIATTTSGGGGTPAGSTGQLQFNNGGVFGATSSPYVTTIMATSTTATSTFANAIIVGTPATTTLTYNQIGILASSTNNGIQFSTNYYSSSFSCGVSSVIGSDGLTYGTVVGADGNCWLDRNLGATEVATSFNDYNAYGSLFQWGRLADGHQSITWTGSGSGTAVHGTTATLSSTDNPGTNLFITISSGPYDWRSPQNDNLWQGVNGTNNPCPIGFRLPTQPEWANLVTAAGITNYTTAYSSSLKLTVAGARSFADGSLDSAGGTGLYWSSSVVGAYAYSLGFDSGSVSPASLGYRGYGFSVRCLKDSGSIISPILLTSSWSLGSLISNNAFTIANSSLLNSLNYLSILTNGNVGIGTTTPATKLDVNGDATIETGKTHVGDLVCYMGGGQLGHMTQTALLAGSGSATCSAN